MNHFTWQIQNDGQPATPEELIKVLLANRSLKSKKDIETFLAPPSPLEVPFESVGLTKVELAKAIRRVTKAIDNKEKIIVYGDYDADGICATAIVWEVLRDLGADVLPYIPERVREGYGLNEDSIAKLKKEDKNLRLIVTVDHGIVGHKKINFAKSLGVDVIVTDHHQPLGTKPEALAILHTTQLSGAGVAWFFARELLKSTSSNNYKLQATSLLELVAIGTITDLIPLTGPNRALVKSGLESIRRTQRPGLKALMEIARVEPSLVGTYEIGYIVGPRLNAAGRIDHALESLRLICTHEIGRARELAAKLDRVNRDRQQLTQDTFIHAKQLYNSQPTTNNSQLVFISHETYEQGIIGLVAGKLVEEFYLPAIVVSIGKEYSKASARSISGFNIIQAIRTAEDLLVDAGGHPMAAGFTIATEKLDLFAEKMNRAARNISGDLLSRSLKIDAKIPLELVSEELFEKLAAFEPYGQGNPEPLFATTGLEVADVRTVGNEGQHLKLRFKTRPLEAIGFKMGELYGQLVPGKPIDVAYNLSRNTWNGRRYIELRLRDIKLSKS